VAVRSIAHAVEVEFNKEHDCVSLLGQDNIRRYLAVPHVRVRLCAADDPVDILITAAAAIAVDCRIVFSHPQQQCQAAIDILDTATLTWAGRLEVVEESNEELADAIGRGDVDRLRLLSQRDLPPLVQRACIERFVPCINQPVIASGWIETLWYLQEQSLSHDYHRYGNLGRRAQEPRRPLVAPPC
jgi:RHH-type proline utilization regulon transcriptional repressor/proline dehydrogenase/delta 1-pyrroline-5-carboxylate dehydrogenase